MVGATRGLGWHQGGWAWATAQGPDNTLQWLRRPCDEPMLVLSDTGCQAAAGDPSHLTLGPRGAWPDRLLVETGRSMLPRVRHVQQGRPRGWAYGHARWAFTRAACNVLVPWHGVQPMASGCVPLSMAQLSLSHTKRLLAYIGD
jgi:hypothetical protein